jgi:hypothetical protein
MRVFCKQGCKSIGGGIYNMNEYYDCIILDKVYFIFDKEHHTIRLDANYSAFSEHFYTEKELRKLKLKKLK